MTSSRTSPRAVPSEVLNWALAQDEPFTARQARAPLGVEVVPDLKESLAAHRSFALADDRFFSARMVARRFACRVMLLDDERMSGFLIPGHRFFGFQFPERDSRTLKLRDSDGRELERRTLRVRKETALQATSLLAPDARGAARGPGDSPLVRADALVFPQGPRADTFRGLYSARCVDFDAGVFDLLPIENKSDRMTGDEMRLLTDILGVVVEEPPPGPLDAERQILHVLAQAWDDLPTLRAIGPLGRILVNADGPEAFDLADRVVFGWESPEPEPRRPGPLPQEVHRFGIECRGSAARAPEYVRQEARTFAIRGVGWSRDQDELVVEVVRRAWEIARVRVAIRGAGTAPAARCSCSLGAVGEPCAHAVAALEILPIALRDANPELVESLRKALVRPAWEWHLADLDRAIARAPAAARMDAAAPQRLVWRVFESEEGLKVSALAQKSGKKGKWTTGRRIALEALGQEGSASDPDIEAAQAILQGRGWSRYGDPVGLSPETLVRALEALSRVPDLFWAQTGDAARIEKTEVRCEAARDASGGVCLRVLLGGTAPGPGGSWQYGREGVAWIDPKERRILVARATGSAVAAIHALLRLPPALPPEATPGVVERLDALEHLLPVMADPTLGGEEVAATPSWVLRLARGVEGGLEAVLGVRPHEGSATADPGAGMPILRFESEGKRKFVRRRLPLEVERGRAIAEAAGLAEHREAPPWCWTVPRDEDALTVLERLRENTPADVRVEWAGERRLHLTASDARELRVTVEKRNDWFGLDGELRVEGGSVSLGALVEALRDGRRFVRVEGDRWLAITDEFRRRLDALADVALPARKGLGVAPVAVPAAAEALREAGHLDVVEAWTALERRFRDAMALDPVPPATLTAELRDYQVEGFRWLARLAAWGAGACLADDMGLGKTVQALAALIERAPLGPALVVAPTSVGANWIAEAAKFAPTLRAVLYRETDRTGPPAFAPGDLVVATYGLALRDADRLEKVSWSTLVLDEAQFVKNSRTKTAAAIARFPADWRLALTGTPVENHLGDLWSLFRALSPGLLGSWDTFRERFAAPIERDRNAVRRQALARLVRPFILRRTKGEVLRELPARTEIVLRAELSPAERALYDQARLVAASRFDRGSTGDPQERIQILAALTRLRQLACHPRLVMHDAPPSSAKLRLFMETVAELRGGRHRALVFSQFTTYLALVREALDAEKISYQYLDGSTPPAARETAVAAFQRGEGDLFLISLKAGGTGLNLTAADYVLILDPWWNPAVEDQAADRAHRIGQTRPVTIYRLVAADTIEDRILALHASKRELIAGVLAGTDAAGRMSSEELIALIRDEQRS
ncbi:MAG: DEAD/DEAH box helicase [Planctomycetes bacterium]|nr:DEAD/DEAH box helicase [Planctomycetota bacterium]